MRLCVLIRLIVWYIDEYYVGHHGPNTTNLYTYILTSIELLIQIIYFHNLINFKSLISLIYSYLLK